MSRLDRIAQGMYIDFFAARGYEEQVPEHKSARWYHMLLLLVPILGVVLFPEAVKAAHEKREESECQP